MLLIIYIRYIIMNDEELSRKRMDICSKCPLCKWHKLFGYMCSNSLYVNPNNESETSTEKHNGWVKGCGCILRLKTLIKRENCSLGKW